MDTVCKFWKTEQGCRKGDRCQWRHPYQNSTHVNEWCPKTPIAIPDTTVNLNKLYKYTKPVIIHGAWSDVKDTDPFY